MLGGIAGRISRALSRLVAGRSRSRPVVASGYRRSWFGRPVAAITLNPVGPFLAIAAAIAFMAGTVVYYGAYDQGLEFFVETEPERAILYAVEERVRPVEGIESVFAFSGVGGLNRHAGNEGPTDAVEQVQIEFARWDERRPGNETLAEIERRISGLPGIVDELATQQEGPEQGKPMQPALKSPDWQDLNRAAEIARARFETLPGLVDIDDTRPLPGIDWEIDVDRETAGRFGADVATIGPLVQLVTRGALLGTYRPDDTDHEVASRRV